MELGKVCCPTCQVPYYPRIPYEYGYQGLDPGSKVHYLLNGIRCNKLSTAVTVVRLYPDKYQKDFDTVVAFLTQYDKRASTPSLKVASVSQTRPAQQLSMALLNKRLS